MENTKKKTTPVHISKRRILEFSGRFIRFRIELLIDVRCEVSERIFRGEGISESN